jgi:hypothetical protein
MSKYSNSILVTGDVIRDVAVYQGDRTFTFEQGTVPPSVIPTVGGARLLYKIIKAAAPPGKAVFAFEEPAAQDLPEELTAYTLWKPAVGGLKEEYENASKKDKPGDVWRVSGSLGYGASVGTNQCRRRAQAPGGARH